MKRIIWLLIFLNAFVFAQRRVETDTLKARAAFKIKISGTWYDRSSFFGFLDSNNKLIGSTGIAAGSITNTEITNPNILFFAADGLYGSGGQIDLGGNITFRVNVDSPVVIINDTVTVADSSITWTKLDTAVMDSIRSGGGDVDSAVNGLEKYGTAIGQKTFRDTTDLKLYQPDSVGTVVYVLGLDRAGSPTTGGGLFAYTPSSLTSDSFNVFSTPSGSHRWIRTTWKLGDQDLFGTKNDRFLKFYDRLDIGGIGLDTATQFMGMGKADDENNCVQMLGNGGTYKTGIRFYMNLPSDSTTMYTQGMEMRHHIRKDTATAAAPFTEANAIVGGLFLDSKFIATRTSAIFGSPLLNKTDAVYSSTRRIVGVQGQVQHWASGSYGAIEIGIWGRRAQFSGSGDTYPTFNYAGLYDGMLGVIGDIEDDEDQTGAFLALRHSATSSVDEFKIGNNNTSKEFEIRDENDSTRFAVHEHVSGATSIFGVTIKGYNDNAALGITGGAAAQRIIIRNNSGTSNSRVFAFNNYASTQSMYFQSLNDDYSTKSNIIQLHADNYINLFNAASPTADSTRVLSFNQKTVDPTMGSNAAGLYAKNVSGTAEMFAIDEAGNAYNLTDNYDAIRQIISDSIADYHPVKELTDTTTIGTSNAFKMIKNVSTDALEFRQGTGDSLRLSIQRYFVGSSSDFGIRIHNYNTNAAIGIIGSGTSQRIVIYNKSGTSNSRVFALNNYSSTSSLYLQSLNDSYSTKYNILQAHADNYINLFGAASPTANPSYTLSLNQGSTDPTIGANAAGLYAKNVSGTAELMAMDENSNPTLLTENGIASFFGSQTKDTLAISGITTNAVVILTIKDATPVTDDMLSYDAITDNIYVYRVAGTTADLSYTYMVLKY